MEILKLDDVLEIRKQLTRPLFIFDLETTGSDTQKDEIVQFYALIIYPEDALKYNKDIEEISFMCKPSIPLSEEASAVTGITNEAVEHLPPFGDQLNKYLRKKILEFTYDFAGYNCFEFDLPIFQRQLLKEGLSGIFDKSYVFDAYKLFTQHFSRSLENAYRYYTKQDIKLEGMHDASIDVRATTKVILEQIKNEMELGSETIEEIMIKSAPGPENRISFTNHIVANEDGNFIFNFGKWKGELIEKHKDYLAWMLKSDFPQDLRNWINNYLTKKREGGLNENDDYDLPF